MNHTDIRISPHFTYGELMCKCGCQRGPIQARAIMRLERLREMLGGFPLQVTSAYRCEAHNKAVGGTAFSQHLQGCAFDIVSRHEDLTTDDAFRSMIAAGFNGIGRGRNRAGNLIVHVDDRRDTATFWKYTPTGIEPDPEAEALYERILRGE